MAQFKIGVGTKLLVKGSNLDDYVIEQIKSQSTPEGTKQYTIEVRTVRQRCFDRALTGFTTWSGDYVLECLNAGSMRIEG